jgi:hypothetical protein
LRKDTLRPFVERAVKRLSSVASSRVVAAVIAECGKSAYTRQKGVATSLGLEQRVAATVLEALCDAFVLQSTGSGYRKAPDCEKAGKMLVDGLHALEGGDASGGR